MTPLIITGLLGTLTAFGAPDAGKMQMRGDGGFHGAGICKKVECTSSQEQQIADIFAAHRAEVASDRAEAQRLRGEMAAELGKSKLDEAKLQRLQTQISQAHAKMAKSRLQSMIEMHGVLTPAQRKTLAEHMATRGPGQRGKGKPAGRGAGG